MYVCESNVGSVLENWSRAEQIQALEKKSRDLFDAGLLCYLKTGTWPADTQDELRALDQQIDELYDDEQ